VPIQKKREQEKKAAQLLQKQREAEEKAAKAADEAAAAVEQEQKADQEQDQQPALSAAAGPGEHEEQEEVVALLDGAEAEHAAEGEKQKGANNKRSGEKRSEKSAKFADIEEYDEEEEEEKKKKRQEEQEDQQEEEQHHQYIIEEDDGIRVAAPQFELIDGKLVLKESSLELDAPAPEELDLPVLFETGTRVTSASFAKRDRADRWSLEDTKRFYRALSQYGTDFTFIAQHFPGRTRSQIKSKYKREERLRPALVDFALKCKTPIDMEEFLKKLAESAALEEVKAAAASTSR